MAGGTFDKLAGKVRPGVYINFESAAQEALATGRRGVVLVPLIDHSYGPEKEFISITASSPDAHIERLGYSIYDAEPSMLLIREALKNASTVLVYIPKQGKKATVTAAPVTATAKYGGARGNDLRFSVVANPSAGFDVTVYLGADVVAQYENLETVEQLMAKECAWIDFSGTGNLIANSGASLTGGVTGEASNADITAFLDASEGAKWNTMAFPIAKTGEESDPAPALFEALKTKIKYLQEGAGKYRKAVVSGFNADYEGILNVTNGVILADGTRIPGELATAWVAGADAGASNTTSNTYKQYDGAVDILNPKTNEEAIAAINNGEFFFSFSEEGEVVVEYDINSLTTFEKPKSSDYRKNRVMRVFHTFAEDLQLNIPPNKYDNSPTGWDLMEGVGRSLLKRYDEAGAIKNVDYNNDFLVNRGASSGDMTYFQVSIQPVDSAEKLFFTITTR